VVEHTIRAFDKDLRQVGDKIAEMGRLDAKQINDAIEALIKRDTALARRVIATDERVDELQRKIEEKVVATIARRQPMAVDLRELVGALRISNDLERVGDLAENIAKRALLLSGELVVNEVVLQLQHMVDLVRDRLAYALQSYEQAESPQSWIYGAGIRKSMRSIPGYSESS
jgi:phosphate transport system protein